MKKTWSVCTCGDCAARVEKGSPPSCIKWSCCQQSGWSQVWTSPQKVIYECQSNSVFLAAETVGRCIGSSKRDFQSQCRWIFTFRCWHLQILHTGRGKAEGKHRGEWQALSGSELLHHNAPAVAEKASAEELAKLAQLLHRSPTLWLCGNTRCVGIFPTHNLHLRASPRAHSQWPIFCARRPASFAHVWLE